MPTLTRNLFAGSGEGTHRLDVVAGHWPVDMDGAVFIVGPDKREPGGHWFGEHGLVTRIDCRPDHRGRIPVAAARVDTPIERLRRRWPRLFRRVAFLDVSPFGISNLANTNVAPLDGRLFLGYDAGRPVEIDPVTLRHVSPVGAVGEWIQTVPGLVEPLVSVAAHPAPAHDEHALYFVNYSMTGGGCSIARWGLTGPVERWPLEGMTVPFDSIHDIKATRDHLVFSDLPFVVEPETFTGADRSRPNQGTTSLWIVAKADLRATPPGSPVRVVEVQVEMPTGHLSVDEDDRDGTIRVNLEHIPLADLMMPLRTSGRSHATGEPFDVGYEGLITLSVQPGAVGRYRIDAATGEVLDADVISDDRFWGAVLSTRDESTPDARARVRDLWYSGCGFDPELVSEEWWSVYGDGALPHLVPPADLPTEALPGALVHVDLEAGKVDEVWHFELGDVPTPPTFVPRREPSGPGDGYVVVLVHRDEGKELQVFDARDLERGPLAVARGDGWCPPLLLHSCWMPERVGPRPSTYRVPMRRDVVGALRGAPGAVRGMARMAREARAAGTGG